MTAQALGNEGVSLSCHPKTDGRLELAAVFLPVDNLFRILKTKEKIILLLITIPIMVIILRKEIYVLP